MRILQTLKRSASFVLKRVLPPVGLAFGVALLLLVFYALGVQHGEAKLAGQISQQGAAQVGMRADLWHMDTLHTQIFQLCEDKYQAYLNGNKDGAYVMKGQMIELQNEFQMTAAKYRAKIQ